MDDKAALDKILQKDETVFKEFLDRYMGLFYKISKKVLQNNATHEDIMDCLSESFIYIWYHIEQYDIQKYSLRNWCSLIVINRAQNQLTSILRQQRKTARYQAHMKSRNLYTPSAEDIYLETEAMNHIIDKINILQPPSKDVFMQRYVYGLKPKQIAKKLNLTTKQVDNYLAHAKKKLRKEGFNNELK